MKIDCTTCKYGYEDEQLGIPMCHHPRRFSEDCVNFNMHEEKETKESEKPINLDDAMKELDQKIGLVKERGTWDGVDVDKYMDEVRGREPKFNLDRLREVAVPLSDDEKEAHRKMMDERRKKYEEMGILQEPKMDFEQELYKHFGQVKDFTLGMRIAQCFFNLGKNAK